MIEELNKALILAVLKTPLKQILDGSLFYFLVDTERIYYWTGSKFLKPQTLHNLNFSGTNPKVFSSPHRAIVSLNISRGYSNSHQKNISNKKRLDKLAVFQVEIKIYVDPLEDSFTMKTIVKEYKRLSLEEVNKAIVLEEL